MTRETHNFTLLYFLIAGLINDVACAISRLHGTL